MARSCSTPLHAVRCSTRKRLRFGTLLFVPTGPNFSLFVPGHGRKLRLCIHGIFVNTSFRRLLPRCLHFMGNMISSDSLPLGISHRVLRSSTVVHGVHSSLMAGVVTSLRNIGGSGPRVCLSFFHNFNHILGRNMHSSFSRRRGLGRLLLFTSSGDRSNGVVALHRCGSTVDTSRGRVCCLITSSVRGTGGSTRLRLFHGHGISILFLASPISR